MITFTVLIIGGLLYCVWLGYKAGMIRPILIGITIGVSYALTALATLMGFLP